MKNMINISVLLVVFLMAMYFNQVSAQDAQKETGKPIPSKVLKIFQKSCPSCHSEPGNLKALSHINFSKWDSCSIEKQAATAIAICNFVSKEQMQRKKLRKKPPVNAPTSHEIKMICNWAQSLQVTTK